MEIKKLSLKKWAQIIFLLSLSGFSTAEAKAQSKKTKDPVVTEERFDDADYGRIEKNEIEVSLKVVQKDSDVLVSLMFENISKRELHVYSSLWFQQLDVKVNENPARYVGPMASLPAPQKNDFKIIQPGDRFTTESVLLNSYFALPRLPGAQCVLKYRFEKYTMATEARFTLK